MKIRVGLGYDAHRLSRSRPLYLGGVKIPHSKGLLGHSDADVILHAIVDSLLGAAGLPDIGAYFSNKDPRWKNVSSLFFLKVISKVLVQKKMKILNIDCVLLSEKPKIAPYIEAMKKNIAPILNIKTGEVGIKASTNEKMGFVGKEVGMCAYAVALLQC